MRSLLKLAFGEQRVFETQVDITGAEPLLLAVAPNASVYISDTVHLQTTRLEADNFFVIATSRRPCDYHLSLWAYVSDGLLNDPAAGSGWPLWDAVRPHRGLEPPYTTPADVSRFRDFMASVQDTKLLASSLSTRLGGADRVHCWVRTHSLFDDVSYCFKYFSSVCGGSIPFPDWKEQVEVLNAASKGSCSAFFADDEQEALMAREDARLAEVDFGRSLMEVGVDRCCSQEEQAMRALLVPPTRRLRRPRGGPLK